MLVHSPTSLPTWCESTPQLSAAAVYWLGTDDSTMMNSPTSAPFLQEVVNNYRRLRSASKG
ncbi:hypothetical protein [Floridanema evergladense]|uniref:Uncharacterized protein n=1 Tax=Floridaenema evergladense BLCC-F167 TaxID=3153639 RepID=A0ABV4WMR7_9CYAN